MRKNSTLSKIARRLHGGGKRYARQRPANVKQFEVLCDPDLDSDVREDSMRPRSYSAREGAAIPCATRRPGPIRESKTRGNIKVVR